MFYSISEESSSCEIYDYDYKLATKMGFNWTLDHQNQIDYGKNTTIFCSTRDFDPSIRSIVTDVSFFYLTFYSLDYHIAHYLKFNYEYLLSSQDVTEN